MPCRKRPIVRDADDTSLKKPCSFTIPSIVWPARLSTPATLDAAARPSIQLGDVRDHRRGRRRRQGMLHGKGTLLLGRAEVKFGVRLCGNAARILRLYRYAGWEHRRGLPPRCATFRSTPAGTLLTVWKAGAILNRTYLA